MQILTYAALIVLLVSAFFSSEASAFSLTSFKIENFSRQSEVDYVSNIVNKKSIEVKKESKHIETISAKEDNLTNNIKKINKDIKKLKKQIKKKKASKRAAVKAERAAQTTVVHTGHTKNNLYMPGTCTWYVKNLRPDIGGTWGNANAWYYTAKAQGWSVGSQPRIGAIATTQAGSYGHVAYVTGVSKGRVTIKEMNYGGLYNINVRTVPASTFKYIY